MKLKQYLLIGTGIFFILIQPFQGSLVYGLIFIAGGLFWLWILNSTQSSSSKDEIQRAARGIAISKILMERIENALAQGQYAEADQLAHQILDSVPDIGVSETTKIRLKARSIISNISSITKKGI